MEGLISQSSWPTPQLTREITETSQAAPACNSTALQQDTFNLGEGRSQRTFPQNLELQMLPVASRTSPPHVTPQMQHRGVNDSYQQTTVGLTENKGIRGKEWCGGCRPGCSL